MSERLFIPIEYVGEVAKSSLLKPDANNLSPIQGVASEALGASRLYGNLSAVKQESALQSLALLGAYTVSSVSGDWPSVRWAESYTDLEENASILVKAGKKATNHDAFQAAYKRLFHMLETASQTMEELGSVKQKSISGESPRFQVFVRGGRAVHIARRTSYFAGRRK